MMRPCSENHYSGSRSSYSGWQCFSNSDRPRGVLGFLTMLAALLLGLLGVIIDVVDLTPVPDDPRPHAD